MAHTWTVENQLPGAPLVLIRCTECGLQQTISDDQDEMTDERLQSTMTRSVAPAGGGETPPEPPRDPRKVYPTRL